MPWEAHSFDQPGQDCTVGQTVRIQDANGFPFYRVDCCCTRIDFKNLVGAWRSTREAPVCLNGKMSISCQIVIKLKIRIDWKRIAQWAKDGIPNHCIERFKKTYPNLPVPTRKTLRGVYGHEQSHVLAHFENAKWLLKNKMVPALWKSNCGVAASNCDKIASNMKWQFEVPERNGLLGFPARQGAHKPSGYLPNDPTPGPASDVEPIDGVMGPPSNIPKPGPAWMNPPGLQKPGFPDPFGFPWIF